MSLFLRIALWNANGLAQHSQELQLFIFHNKLDIVLISETHFTDRSYFKLPYFKLYHSNHPDNTAHGGSAILIKESIKHYELPNFQLDYLQATSLVVEDWTGPLTLSAVYCPPRHVITQQQFENFFNNLGNKFLAGGDYNAKHQHWGSRLATPRGRQLLNTITNNNFDYLSTGQPTYWPTDRNKIPDVLDFFVTKGMPRNFLNIVSNFDLSSDHSPVIVTVGTTILHKQPKLSLSSKHTNWDYYRQLINESLNMKIPLQSIDDIDNALDCINVCIQTAAKEATPSVCSSVREIYYPVHIKNKIAEKRQLRRIWQNSRNPNDKTNLNRATQHLKRLLFNIKNQWFNDYTSSLSASETSDYTLWKATKRIKQPIVSIPPIARSDGTWAKSNVEKAEAFAQYFTEVFQPNEQLNDTEEELLEFIESPLQLDFPIQLIKPSEVRYVLNREIKPNKCPGHDLITGKLLKELPRKAVTLISVLFNAIIRMEYFPKKWKQAQLIVIPKPGKPLNQLNSYRPISLLPILSKVFEKIFLKRLRSSINEDTVLPNHQFGFRQKHSTTEQVHRVVETVRQTIENKQYCSAAFLDVSQAFDKVWHIGLLYKIKQLLPNSYYHILKSYLTNRCFQIKYEDVQTPFYDIKSGVPQGSVLGPYLYLLYTSDLPVNPFTCIATYADDTAVLSVHENAITASQNLQNGLNDITGWLDSWRIKVNVNKSVHITFTLRNETCPPVVMCNTQLPQVNEVKYLGMHLDRRLTWKSHIWLKRQQLNLKFNKLNWLLLNRSKLSLENKLLIYKVILKPIWTYGIQLWGTSSVSNIEIIQRFQSKALRKIANAPWYVSNQTLHKDMKIPFVKEEITRFSENYLKKLEDHPNHLAVNLLDNSNTTYRLNRCPILDLPLRFNQ